MDQHFLQSWKGALLIAGIVTLGVTGTKLVFGPDRAERIAELRAARAFPGGRPSPDIMARQIVGGPVVTPFGLNLEEFTTAFEGVTSTYEPIDQRTFILRMSRTDPLTDEPQEWSFHCVAVEGPREVGLPTVFEGPAVYVTGMAYNRETASPIELFQIFNIAAGIAQRARTGQ